MRCSWPLLAAGVAVCGMTTGLAAQSRTGIAIIPFAGYAIPGALTDNDTFLLEPKAVPLAGVAIELNLSKNLSLSIGASRTVGQDMDVSSVAFLNSTVDMAMTQIAGSIVFRPGGRRPNGSPTPLFIEVGGGMNFYTFGNFIIGSTAIPAEDWKSTRPMGMAGAGVNFPIGPRASVQVFGRAVAITKYSSTGLDDFNSAPPPTGVVGTLALGFQVGVGLRVGR